MVRTRLALVVLGLALLACGHRSAPVIVAGQPDAGAPHHYSYPTPGGATFAFDPSVTSPQITHTVVPGTGTAAGQQLSILAQSGQAQSGTVANNNGGTLVLGGGAAGTGGDGGAGVAGAAILESDQTAELTIQGHQAAPSTDTLTLTSCPALTWVTATDTPVISQAVAAGTGSAQGKNFSIQAQAGQQQTGGANNNAGGQLVLVAGAPGTGGSGSAALPGIAALESPGPGAGAALLEVLGSATSSSTANAVQLLQCPNVSWISQGDAPLLSQVQQANGSNPNNTTIKPQAPGAGASSTSTGTPGSLAVNVAAPVSTGGEAGFILQRVGSTIFQVTAAPPATSYTNIYLAGNTANGSYALEGNATTTLLNAASGGTVYLRIGNALAAGIYTSNGLELFSETASFGGGTGVLGVANASALFNAVTSGGGAVAHDSIGLHYDGPSTSFNDYMVAPVQQGTANTQVEKSRVYSGVCRTTTNSAVTCLTIPCATSGSVCSMVVTCSGRDVVSGTVGDSFTYDNTVGFKNVSGTVTGATVQGTALNAHDTSMATVAVSYTVSGTNVLVQVTGLSSVTIDYTCEARVINN